ncbi:MAG: hypothetical protein CMA88_00980 [Euryarchaeota archaeon]|nr:hypothetical protein [Euryarchaeota archaeon]
MDGSGTLPNRTEVGSKAFSPWVDRITLVSLAFGGVLAAPEISSMLGQWLGVWSMAATVCGLVVLVPLISTSIGKMYVRIRA